MIYRLWKEIRPRNLESGGGVRKKLPRVKMPQQRRDRQIKGTRSCRQAH